MASAKDFINILNGERIVNQNRAKTKRIYSWLLKRDRAYTPKHIAKVFGCSNAYTFNALTELKTLGYIEKVPYMEGKTYYFLILDVPEETFNYMIFEWPIPEPEPEPIVDDSKWKDFEFSKTGWCQICGKDTDEEETNTSFADFSDYDPSFGLCICLECAKEMVQKMEEMKRN